MQISLKQSLIIVAMIAFTISAEAATNCNNIMTAAEVAKHKQQLQTLRGAARNDYRNAQYQILRKRSEQLGCTSLPANPPWARTKKLATSQPLAPKQAVKVKQQSEDKKAKQLDQKTIATKTAETKGKAAKLQQAMKAKQAQQKAAAKRELAKKNQKPQPKQVAQARQKDVSKEPPRQQVPQRKAQRPKQMARPVNNRPSQKDILQRQEQMRKRMAQYPKNMAKPQQRRPSQQEIMQRQEQMRKRMAQYPKNMARPQQRRPSQQEIMQRQQQMRQRSQSYPRREISRPEPVRSRPRPELSQQKDRLQANRQRIEERLDKAINDLPPVPLQSRGSSRPQPQSRYRQPQQPYWQARPNQGRWAPTYDQYPPR